MQEIIESLYGVGFKDPQVGQIEESLNLGIDSASFRSLISWLTIELGILLNLDEQVHPGSESTEFVLELSSLLKELGCPYSVLVSGPPSQRFQSKDVRILLLNYLVSELMAAKMIQKLNPQKKIVIEILESPAACALKSITQNLNLGKPPQNIAPKAFFDKLLNQFSELYKKNEPFWGKSLFQPSKSLTFEEWKKLEKLQNELDSEYDLRREMLMTRLDVTIQSFQWAEVAKIKGESIIECYSSKRQKLYSILRCKKATDIIELLAARNDLLFVEKTSSANVRKNTQTGLQKHIIGNVPDRGGRANEHQPPPPEMPAWQKNRNNSGQGSGNRGNGRGFTYKGQNPQQQRNYQQNYQPQGSYQHSSNYSGSMVQSQNSGSGDSNFSNSPYNNNRGGGNSRVQRGGNRDNFRSYGHENYYNMENNGAGLNRSFQGPQYNQDYNRRGDSFNRNQSNYNRGGRR